MGFNSGFKGLSKRNQHGGRGNEAKKKSLKEKCEWTRAFGCADRTKVLKGTLEKWSVKF